METLVVEKLAEYGPVAILAFFGFRYFVAALERKDAQTERITADFADKIDKITDRFTVELSETRKINHSAAVQLALVQEALRGLMPHHPQLTDHRRADE